MLKSWHMDSPCFWTPCLLLTPPILLFPVPHAFCSPCSSCPLFTVTINMILISSKIFFCNILNIFHFQSVLGSLLKHCLKFRYLSVIKHHFLFAKCRSVFAYLSIYLSIHPLSHPSIFLLTYLSINMCSLLSLWRAWIMFTAMSQCQQITFAGIDSKKKWWLLRCA